MRLSASHSRKRRLAALVVSDVWAFDLEAKTWAEVDIPVEQTAGERSSHTCTMHITHDGVHTMFVFGGMLGQRLTDQIQPVGNDVWKLSLSGGLNGETVRGDWSQITAFAGDVLPPSRFDHTAVRTSRG